MDKKTPRLVLRPHFDQGLTMVYAGLVTAGALLVLPLLLGVFLFLLGTVIGLGMILSVGWMVGTIAVVCVVVIPPLYFEIRKRALARTYYRFFDDYLEFQYLKFYVQPRRGRLRYRDIEDVYQQASALQEQRYLTSIYLYAPSLQWRQGLRSADGFSGVKIADIKQKPDPLVQVQSLLESALAAPTPAALMPAKA